MVFISDINTQILLENISGMVYSTASDFPDLYWAFVPSRTCFFWTSMYGTTIDVAERQISESELTDQLPISLASTCGHKFIKFRPTVSRLDTKSMKSMWIFCIKKITTSYQSCIIHIFGHS